MRKRSYLFAYSPWPEAEARGKVKPPHFGGIVKPTWDGKYFFTDHVEWMRRQASVSANTKEHKQPLGT